MQLPSQNYLYQTSYLRLICLFMCQSTARRDKENVLIKTGNGRTIHTQKNGTCTKRCIDFNKSTLNHISTNTSGKWDNSFSKYQIFFYIREVKFDFINSKQNFWCLNFVRSIFMSISRTTSLYLLLQEN